MSVLLAGLEPGVALAVTRRLVAQGDQVRMIAPEGHGGAPPDVHVATGDLDDEDLVERACQGVRTIVLGDVPDAARSAAPVAAARAGVDRVVFVDGPPPAVPPPMSWIALLLPRRRLLGSTKPLPPDSIAEAVDAADDLAGEPQLVADLGTDAGWRALRLEPPR